MDSAIDNRPTDEAHNARPSPSRGATRVVAIGSVDLPPKEHVLLRSLVRLLRSQFDGIELQMLEDPAGCQIVFVPSDWGTRLPPERVCIWVRRESGGEHRGGGLSLEAPLRASNVGAVLRAAIDQLQTSEAGHVGLAALFQAITTRLLAQERRAAVFQFQDGRQLCVRFAEGLVLGNFPLDSLLRSDSGTIEVRRAGTQDLASFDGNPPARLKDLVWHAAFRLGQREGHVVRADDHLHYRLMRWPDAIALARPGVPKLAALFTSRAMSLAQASEAAGMSPSTTRRFMEACIALGLAAVVSDDPNQGASPSASAPAASGLLSRLKDRLKLW